MSEKRWKCNKEFDRGHALVFRAGNRARVGSLGAYSISHPWNAGSTVTIQLEEPGHPLVRCFAADSFSHTDEIFVFNDFSRAKVRVLLRLDTARTDMNKPGVTDRTGDYPLSWVRGYGRGRVFYSALGHQKDVYWRPTILAHYLAGIQFAAGDLDADAAPAVARK
jgi:type 1 glutamine amidotransferase